MEQLITKEEVNIFSSPITLAIHLKLELKDFQQDYILDCMYTNRIVGLFCRQLGKTTTTALFCIWYALMHNDVQILIVAPMQEHALEFYSKLKDLIERSDILKDFTTTNRAELVQFYNNSKIKFLSVGPYGLAIRGKSNDVIVEEESPYIKDKIVKTVIIPTGATKPNLKYIKIGTPFGKNHFYEASMNDRWKVHHYDYSHGIRTNLITQEFIDEQKENLTSTQFNTEYGALFVDDSDSYFTFELINNCIENKDIIDTRVSEIRKKSTYVLGLDIARFGEDKTVYIVLEKPFDEDKIYTHYIFETEYKPLTDVIERVKFLHSQYNFEKVIIDETGLGAGVVDSLKSHLQDRLEGVTFTMKSKQDLYTNLQKLMERGKIRLLNHKKLLFELIDLKKSIAKDEKNVLIHHPDKGHDDYPSALALATWYFREQYEYKPFFFGR